MTKVGETEGSAMSQTTEKRDAVDVTRLVAGAAKTVTSVRYCWLATASEAGPPRVRPMGRVLNDPGEDEWTIRLLTDGRSRKAADMRREGEVAILFQHDPDLAFVTLIGKSALHDSASEVRERWKRAYDVYFPTEADRANAIFVQVEVERMELWIRDVTPEPFGLRATVLERDAGGGWRVVAS
jgi:general stress protein 26